MLAATLILVIAAGRALAAPETDDLDARRLANEEELAGLQDQIELSERRKGELDAEIAGLEADRAAINRNLIDTSARARALEERIERSARRLEDLRGEEDRLRQSLKERRGVLIEVTAALQRLGYNPPPALLVTPKDALSSVRSAILLGAVVPEIRAETEMLIGELTALAEIRESIDESRATLLADLGGLAEEERRLMRLLEEKKQLTNKARDELARQTALAAELAGKANNLEGLIQQLETEISSVRAAAEAAKQAELARKREEEKRIAAAREEIAKPDFSDTARITPAMAFGQAKGLLPRPVSGVELIGFNRPTRSGDLSKGVSVATRAGSRVLSPADGWVIYSGPFRSYGQLLILNAGDDYHVVLAGMERIDVQLGQFVLAGEPVGAMGTRRIASAGEVTVGSLRPVLYIEFRKDGKSIDPAPWWADTTLEERSG